MSRIHEALKKAEQERAAMQGGPSQPGYANPEPPMTPGAGDSATAGYEGGMGAESRVASMPPLANSFSLEALLARCPPRPWAPEMKTMLFFNGEENSRGMEEFRTLRSRLYDVRDKMPLQKLLVTSALPKEGKSFTASNLAQVLVRQHGRRVLLIDADLRGPRLHLMLGTTASPGLADYLRGACDEFEVMQRGPMENLFFIPSGEEISDPSELIASARMKLLLQRVEAVFDWIIVDSPPAVPVSDASVLAKVCDGVLLVVRSSTTSADMARRAREEFPAEALVGVVLNGINKETAPYPDYYYEADQKSQAQSKT
jgi:protein-tyrosine kinase